METALANNNVNNKNDKPVGTKEDQVKNEEEERPVSSYRRMLPNPPTLIEHSGMRFVVMDAPSESNVDLYVKELLRLGVTDLVRVCDATYPKEAFEQQGIKVHELLFPDGESPPDAIVDSWLRLVESRNSPQTEKKGSAIAVHCVAGLGRAPALVAISLIEAGVSPLDAVLFLRQRRRGAINNKQLRYLESYHRRGHRPSSPSNCLIQ